LINKKRLDAEEKYSQFRIQTKELIKELGYEEAFIRMAWSVSILLNKEISYANSKKEDLR